MGTVRPERRSLDGRQGRQRQDLAKLRPRFLPLRDSSRARDGSPRRRRQWGWLESWWHRGGETALGRETGNGKVEAFGDVDLVTGGPVRPDGAGMYLHWDGRKTYRTRMPVPRVLEPIKKLSYGDQATGNLIIEGDNLQVMVSLRPQYRSRIDVAYLDPPYNTGKRDFRYSDRRFHDPNADSDDAVYVNNEDGGRHTKWLNYMGPRLWLVWELLADHGVCFVSINDVELFRLGMLMDEIFGEANRIGVIVWKSQTDNNPSRIAIDHEYVLCYAKRIEEVPAHWVGESAAKAWLMSTYEELAREHSDIGRLEAAYQKAMRDHVKAFTAAEKEGQATDLTDLGTFTRYSKVDERGPFASMRHTENPRAGGYRYDVPHPVTGNPCKIPPKGYRFPEERMKQLVDDDRIIFFKDESQPVQLKRYLSEVRSPLRSIIDTTGRHGAAELKRLFADGAARFTHPKPVELMEQLLQFAADIDALVLDPFAGSGTTAHAVLRLNARDGGGRRFIMIEEGSEDDRYCRTLTAPRIRAAIEEEDLKGGYTFLESGRRLNREAILELERQAITNLIVQTDITGVGGHLTRVDGEHVIAYNGRREAICLRWNGRSDSTITGELLVKMFAEAKKRRLNKPLRVYGSTCVVGETDSFRFCQIPDEIVAALSLSDEAEEAEAEAVVAAVETLETASQGNLPAHGRN
jgi:adenine-specific DNA-methyltransferase